MDVPFNYPLLWILHKRLAIYTWMQAQSNNWNYNWWKHSASTVGSMLQCIFAQAKDSEIEILWLENTIMLWKSCTSVCYWEGSEEPLIEMEHFPLFCFLQISWGSLKIMDMWQIVRMWPLPALHISTVKAWSTSWFNVATQNGCF